jgi:hypothetical protein
MNHENEFNPPFSLLDRVPAIRLERCHIQRMTYNLPFPFVVTAATRFQPE